MTRRTLRPGGRGGVAEGIGRGSGERGLGLLDDGDEGGGLVDGEVGEDLAVDLDAGEVEAVDQARVGKARVMLTDRGVDALDPQGAEGALADLAVAGRVLERLVDRLLGGAVVGRAGAVIAGGLLDDLTVPRVAGGTGCDSGHLSGLLQRA